MHNTCPEELAQDDRWRLLRRVSLPKSLNSGQAIRDARQKSHCPLELCWQSGFAHIASICCWTTILTLMLCIRKAIARTIGETTPRFALLENVLGAKTCWKQIEALLRRHAPKYHIVLAVASALSQSMLHSCSCGLLGRLSCSCQGSVLPHRPARLLPAPTHLDFDASDGRSHVLHNWSAHLFGENSL